MADPVEHLKLAVAMEPIQTEAQAIAWLENLIAHAALARDACDAPVTPAEQQKAFQVWLVRHGSALGSLTALFRVGMVGQVAYGTMRNKIMAGMLPTVNGKRT